MNFEVEAGRVLAIVGESGSGKSTTMAACLSRINSQDINILTAEDPIEYQIQGVGQLQVNPKIDLTFAKALRSFLRQDPDVIMVGEVRDSETAELAVTAALTGHLVISSLHTNEAAGSFPRLIDMGVNADILGASVTTAMAQRLVRRLCPNCREPKKIEGEDRATMDTLLRNIPHADELPENKDTMWTPKGCEKCGGLGYKGRIAVVEVILMDSEIEDCVRHSSSERDIWRAAKHQNIRRMAQDGAVKVLQGVTSLEELSRVVDLKDPTMLETIGGDPAPATQSTESAPIEQPSL